MNKTKSYSIAREVVWEGYKRVKANKGAAGVDEQSITKYEEKLENNLYKLWNRMSSGSYMPAPVRVVKIPKADGKERALGIPTVEDRIAQMVVKIILEPKLEPIFHEDSYGYRPGKSAKEAIGVARKRCWRNNWVVDIDIKGYFDNIDHDLMMRALERHTQEKWILLYIKRWLKAPAQHQDGTLQERNKGTPQGGVISPLLANLFLHYAFDGWMRRNYPNIPFERYADDTIVHCKSESQAKWIKEAISRRLAWCKLEMHPEKTKIVYCKDEDRKGKYPNEKFDFLGYTFRARRSKNRWGKYFINFSPAVSDKASKGMRDTMRSWGLQRRSDKTLQDISHMFNPIVRGWINYYGSYYRSALYPTFRILNQVLVKWAMRKYKRLKGHQRRARYWLEGIAKREPQLFAHWQMGMQPTAG
ncbi:MAG: group II intron reverse transcriptase/maturase [Candidatus Omnitrophota bacterium]|jgi:RNA-directed DNA polymerase